MSIIICSKRHPKKIEWKWKREQITDVMELLLDFRGLASQFWLVSLFHTWQVYYKVEGGGGGNK